MQRQGINQLINGYRLIKNKLNNYAIHHLDACCSCLKPMTAGTSDIRLDPVNAFSIYALVGHVVGRLGLSIGF
jgi:hypothetical protein